jgi:hypothetical protein
MGKVKSARMEGDEYVVRYDTRPVPTGSLGTESLPTEVVDQEASVTAWMTTDQENPRRGNLAVGYRLGGRENPPLTADEREYVARVFEAGARLIRQQGVS